jgi:hypothetical protein
VESAINENPDLPGFIRQFQPAYPIGVSDNAKVHEFMQIGMFVRSFVPFMVLIDRKGVIRYQHTGSEQDYFTEDFVKQTMNIREEVEKLLAEPAAKPVRKAAVKKSAK